MLTQADSTTIVGQCEISHPVKPPALSVVPPSPADLDAIDGDQQLELNNNASFEKSSSAEGGGKVGYDVLSSRITRISHFSDLCNDMNA